MTTSIQEFAKENGYRMHQAKSIIKKALGNLPDTLSDEDLTQISNYNDSEDESKALSPAPKQKQLASSKTEETQQPESTSQLATTEESSLADVPVQTEPKSHLSTIEQIEQVSSELQLTRINQRLDDDYTRLVNALNAHDKRKEDLLLSRLETTYQSVKNHKPLEEQVHSTSRFDDLMTKIDALGIETKSR